jgi:hypothetical protein
MSTFTTSLRKGTLVNQSMSKFFEKNHNPVHKGILLWKAVCGVFGTISFDRVCGWLYESSFVYSQHMGLIKAFVF